ncbi:hypothetical protein SAMN05443637_11926 [Pseudonocardia thermophila]|jgi:hypothetical protein|uniref:Proteins of 100 residues with WXG n=2 Tax=Pseudonocardia thermophila TaxID=1848 RepID=A0A1M6Y7G9_PSETH|nr:hypothetical protein [Pseudonocardia thermophila]SHL14123.1 hypothetical protein SAMN05443637_11926 [Pseudonocardia thermophila]
MTSPTTYGTADLVQQAQDLLNRIRQDVASASAAVRSVAAELPVGAETVVQAVDDVTRQTNDALTQIQVLIDEPGVPDDLVRAGAVWAGPIQEAVTTVKAAMNPSELAGARLWKGLAGSAYNATLLPQANALTTIADACADINKALNDLAGAIHQFWVATIVALLGLAAAAGAFAVAVFASAAGAAIGAAALTFVAAIATYYGATAVASATIDGAVTSTKAVIQNRLGNNTGFPEGHWPQSTAVTGHASFADDSRPSDWQLVE